MEDSFETRELLNSTHDFPCPYLFKAIGSEPDHFIGRVLGAFREVLGEDVEPPFTFRKSSKGNHVSVSVEPVVEGADQIIKIYSNLRQVDGLVMLM